MHTQILKRVGAALLALGIIDMAITIARLAAAGPYPAAFDLTAIIAGIFLWRGSPRAGLWVRTIAVFILTITIGLLIAAPLFQPLDLSITEIRLDPAAFAAKLVPLILLFCVTLWVSRQLGRPLVQNAIAITSFKRWDMRIPAQAGGGLVALTTLLLWLALHGQTAALATSLAFDQLGPGYRYHLSWISSAGSGHGTTVKGVVTAWNEKEIKQVLLHWETR